MPSCQLPLQLAELITDASSSTKFQTAASGWTWLRLRWPRTQGGNGSIFGNIASYVSSMVYRADEETSTCSIHKKFQRSNIITLTANADVEVIGGLTIPSMNAAAVVEE